MRATESDKTRDMRRLAQSLRDYAAQAGFAVYADAMTHVAEELDQCADQVAARASVLQ